MALDGITLGFIKNELGAALGSRVEKVHQPSKDELVLVLRGRDGQRKLLISARASSPRIHFTASAPENPANPPMLCMLLRKHLASSALAAVRQPGEERVLFLDFDATNEIGDPVRLTLAVEIMAQYSNVILINGEGIILDSLRRVDMTESSLRQILPGMLYRLPPPQKKLSLSENTAEEIVAAALNFEEKQTSFALINSVRGISPIVARELACRAAGEDKKVFLLTDAEKSEMTKEVKKLAELVKKALPQPTAVIGVDGKPLDFCFFAPLQYGDAAKLKSYDSFSQLLDDYYFERDRLERSKQSSQELHKCVAAAVQRIARTVSIRQEELRRAQDREQLRVFAELISANLYRLEKGAPFYDVENYYDENKPLRIPADPSLSPSLNSQKYYKEYRKMKTAAEMLVGLIASGEAELEYVESVRDLLSRAVTAAELAAIREELIQAGYLKSRNKKQKGKEPKALPPIEYASSDGFVILVGRNNVQNDKLTLRDAAKTDVWLHTQKIHGSHTIIVTDGKEPSEKTLYEAALIAAYNSRARGSSGVPVDYTIVRNLKKPVGARPGKVIYTVYSTLFVTPERDVVEALLKKD